MDPSRILHAISENLLPPIPLCFAQGIFCKLIHGGIKIPKDLYYTIAIFLLMSIGFMGGLELAHMYYQYGWGTRGVPAASNVISGVLHAHFGYSILRYIGRMSFTDSAGIAKPTQVAPAFGPSGNRWELRS